MPGSCVIVDVEAARAGLHPPRFSLHGGLEDPAVADVVVVPLMRFQRVRLTLDVEAARALRRYSRFMVAGFGIAAVGVVLGFVNVDYNFYLLVNGRQMVGAPVLNAAVALLFVAASRALVAFRPTFYPVSQPGGKTVKLFDLDERAAREWAQLNPGAVTLCESDG